MISEVIVCTLAAAGLIFIGWCLAGACVLPACGGALLCFWDSEREARLRRCLRAYDWLRDTGLLRAEIYLVDLGVSPDAAREAQALARETGARYCTKAALAAWLTGGATEIGTDRADAPAGDGGCRHISE